MAEVTKAIIPIAGLATRFLPLSKVVSKELWPVVDLPLFQYIIEEAKNSGIKEIIFVTRPKEKILFNYLTPSPQLEKALKEKKKNDILGDLQRTEDLFKSITFSSVVQKRALGDGHAILQAARLINDEPVAVLFVDDIVDSKTPCLAQLTKVFKTCQKPVVALYRLPKERIPFYGVVKVERIASRLYKIKQVVEKPSADKAPSDLAVVGKYILTPEVFQYLKKAEPNERGEIIIADTLQKMNQEGKLCYGYEFEGKWLECGNKMEWLKTNACLALKHPQYGPELRKYLKEIIK